MTIDQLFSGLIACGLALIIGIYFIGDLYRDR